MRENTHKVLYSRVGWLYCSYLNQMLKVKQCIHVSCIYIHTEQIEITNYNYYIYIY